MLMSDNLMVFVYLNEQEDIVPFQLCLLSHLVVTLAEPHVVETSSKFILENDEIVEDHINLTEWSLLLQMFDSVCHHWENQL